MHTPFPILLGLVCSPRSDESHTRRLEQACSEINDWPGLVHLATDHRLTPLLYRRLRDIGIGLPTVVRRTLAGAWARQRTVSAAQAATLAELGAAFARSGIEMVVLKGGALAHLVYPEPALRPMEDLDLLVSSDQAASARELLRDCGFNAPGRFSRYDRLQHHDPIAHRTRNGITVSVELHLRAFNLVMGDDLALDRLERPLTAFDLAGQPLHTLAPAQMMWMQYLGLRKLAEPMRLIHLADLAAIATCFHRRVDWTSLRRTSPDLWHAYRAIHAFAPLPAAACRSLALDTTSSPRYARIGSDYHGWPRARASASMWRRIGDTLLPPDWWAHLVYGVAPGRGAYSLALWHHAATFVRQGLRRLYLGPVTATNFFKPPG